MLLLGYHSAQSLVKALSLPGALVSREEFVKVLRQTKLKMDLLLPGIEYDFSQEGIFGLRRVSLGRYDGQSWKTEGDLRDVMLPQPVRP